jgi:hypothetical protein
VNGVILQPTYLPWLGYFEILDASEIYVIYDHVQYVRKSNHNRNRIKGPNGEIILSVPVKKAPQNTCIRDIEISYTNGNALLKHWKTIQNAYCKAPYFEQYHDTFAQIYSRQYQTLIKLTVKLISTICTLLGIDVQFVYSSDYERVNLQDTKTGRVVDLCIQSGIKMLYDTKGAGEFIDPSLFKDNNLEVKFQSYNHPEYHQQYGAFLPYMSVIDLIFNEGPNSLTIIQQGIGR